MTAYIVGLVVGALTTVSPLVYMMNYDRSLARILSRQPEFDPAIFSADISSTLVFGIAAVGVFVLIVSTIMIAVTGLKQLKNAAISSGTGTGSAAASGEKNAENPLNTEEETAF